MVKLRGFVGCFLRSLLGKILSEEKKVNILYRKNLTSVKGWVRLGSIRGPGKFLELGVWGHYREV